MTNALITKKHEQEETETSLSVTVVQQLEDSVARAERSRNVEEKSGDHWFYSVPCAGVRYYRY